jgi:hypothetical protein
MRLFARVLVILILLGCGTGPLLYGSRAAAAKGHSGSAPKLAMILTELSRKVKLSEPAWLFVLGAGLVVSAGRLPRILNSRAYARRRTSTSAGKQRGPKLMGKKPLSLKAVS